jgi:hypothetical protein
MNAPENGKKESNKYEIHKEYLFDRVPFVCSSSVLPVPEKVFTDHLTFTDGTKRMLTFDSACK